LGIQKVRMMYLPGWIEPANDNADPAVTDLPAFTFDGVDFASLLRELDACEALGIEVNLTVWGADRACTPWLSYPGCEDWLSAPNDVEEYAENISVLLDYLLHTKRYACVKELTLFNEPDWAFKNNDSRNAGIGYFEEMCRAVHGRLQRDGLRDNIRLILSDDTYHLGWLKENLRRMSGIADGFNSHTYQFGAEAPLAAMRRWAARCNKAVNQYAPGKPYTHNEFGSHILDAYHQGDPDAYENGLGYAMMAASFLGEGSSGMLKWCFFDQYYYDGPREDALMALGLFKYKDEGWAVRPAYHAWGLLMRHTEIGMEIYGIRSCNPAVSGVAFRSAEGKWVYLIVNADHRHAKTIRVDNAAAGDAIFDRYLYAKGALPADDAPIAPDSTLAAAKGRVCLELPADSFAILVVL
ncbi:MAG: hypothetical protein FWF60_08845, partial [Oscillospiraceae bacterium]|nr:hypothetical protein [Oscillospiraceae bacterium]